MRDMLKRVTFSAAFFMISFGSSGVLAQGKPSERPPMPVKAASVIRETFNVEVTAIGTLRADEVVLIRPEIAGRVVTIHFREGAAVRRDEPLVTLDQDEYKAQLAGSIAQLKLTQSNYQRLLNLKGKNLTSEQDLDEAEARLDAARTRRELDEVRLNKTVLRAPFAGVVGLRQVSPGAYLEPGDNIAKLENLASMKLDFRVPETYLAQLAVGQALSVRVDAYPDQKFTGNIYAIDPALDEETRTVLLRARLPNRDNKLRPGLFARIKLVLEQRKNTLVAPEEAIVPMGQSVLVYKVVDGKAVTTPVKLGLRRPGQVEILDGLTDGDQIVTDGQLKIRDGAPVMVLPPPNSESPAADQ